MGFDKEISYCLISRAVSFFIYMAIQAQEIENALKWRYATKKFDSSKKISAQNWKILEQALILSPSSYGLQPWKFIVVESPEVRKQLTAVSWGQTQVEDCSHYVVMAAKTSMDENYIQKFISHAAKVRGVGEQSMDAYKGMMVGDLVKGPRNTVIAEWAARQAYIALGTLMMVAAMQGVDSCPMEGIDPGKYDEILKVKGTGYRVLCACALGYRSPEDKYALAAKVRFDSAEVIQRV